MKRYPSSGAHFKSSSSSPDIPDATDQSAIESSLLEKQSSPASSTWSADAADLFILLCSFLLTAASIAYVALVFNTQGNAGTVSSPIPTEALSILQRVISALSLTITSAVIMVAGRRYVLFKLTRGGLRTRRVAVYSNASIGNLASYLVSHGVELALLGLSTVWGLALVTGLTVNSSWGMGSASAFMDIGVPSGPSDSATPGSSWFTPASEQLDFVMSSLCFGVAGTVGLINITGTDLVSGLPTGAIYYPPLPSLTQNIGFSFPTTMNGLNVSMEQLSSTPSTAQNLSCVPSVNANSELWSDTSDDQTLSIIVVDLSDPTLILRFNATPIIMYGTLSSTGSYTEFALNGTSWPNVMPTGSQWAQDITSLICNTTCTNVGVCAGKSFSDFAGLLNTDFESVDGDGPYPHWSTMLSMALGAYSFAGFQNSLSMLQNVDGGLNLAVLITIYDAQFTPRYGTYVLILNIIVSVIMLIIIVKLRLASHLGADFINSTRLLLDPLKKQELFNASLKTTVDALADPYMLVREDNTFALAEGESAKEGTNWMRRFALRRHWHRGTNPIKPRNDDDDDTLVEK